MFNINFKSPWPWPKDYKGGTCNTGTVQNVWPLCKSTESITCNRKLLCMVGFAPSPHTKVSFKNWNRNASMMCPRSSIGKEKLKPQRMRLSVCPSYFVATSKRALHKLQYSIVSGSSCENRTLSAIFGLYSWCIRIMLNISAKETKR